MKLEEELARYRLASLCLLFATIGALPYLATLSAGFVFDDATAILQNPLVTGDAELLSAFERGFWGREPSSSLGSYRPLTVLTFVWDYRIGGGAPWSFHLTNLLLHALTCATLFAVLASRFDRTTAALACTLFAIHALHTENVAALVARADVLATLLVLVALWVARLGSRRSWIAGLCFFLALLAKEIAVAAVAILLADIVLGLDSDKPRRPKLLALSSMIIALAAYLALRYFALHIVAAPVRIQGNPLLDASGVERLYTCAALLWRSFELMLMPWRLVADYSYPAILPSSNLFAPDVLLGLVLFLAIPAALFLLRKREPQAAWGVAVFFAAYVPISNLLVLVPTIFAERLLYLPLIGFSVVAARVLCRLPRTRFWQRTAMVFMASYLLFHSARSGLRSDDWESDRKIFAAAVETEPTSMLSYLRLGGIERRAGNLDAAAANLRRAIEVAPTFANPYSELGIVLDLQGAPAEAHRLLTHALRIGPSCAACSNNLIVFLLKYGRFDAAEIQVRKLETRAHPYAQPLRSELEALRARYQNQSGPSP